MEILLLVLSLFSQAVLAGDDRFGFATHFSGGWPTSIMPTIASTGVGWIRDNYFAWDYYYTAAHKAGLKVCVIVGNESEASTAAKNGWADAIEVLNEPNNAYAHSDGPNWQSDLVTLTNAVSKAVQASGGFIGQSATGPSGSLVIGTNTWTFGPIASQSGYPLFENGTRNPGIAAKLFNLNGTLIALNANNQWYQWSGSAWSGINPPKGAVPPVIGLGAQGSQIFNMLDKNPKIDGVVYHPYAYDANTPETTYEWEYLDYGKWIQAIGSHTRLPKWETEWGGWGNPNSTTSNLLAQSKFISRRFLQTAGLGIQHSFVYEYQDNGSELFGVTYANGGQKPSYSIIQKMISVLQGVGTNPAQESVAPSGSVKVGADTYSWGTKPSGGNDYAILKNGTPTGGYGVLMENLNGAFNLENSQGKWFGPSGAEPKPQGTVVLNSIANNDFFDLYSYLYSGPGKTVVSYWSGNHPIQIALATSACSLSFNSTTPTASSYLMNVITGQKNMLSTFQFTYSSGILTVRNLPVDDSPRLIVIL